MKIPLNQTYRVEKTLLDYPEIKEKKEEYERYCLEEVKWHKYGRSYDCAVSLSVVDFKDKVVCELGARDSIFSSYITKFVETVFASDTFQGWGDLGNLGFWNLLWKRFAHKCGRHVTEFQDMRNLTYEDNSMDIVVSFSAIEHIPHNGDMLAAAEMARVCKPGGVIIIGTDMCREHQWNAGGYFYDQESFQKRIIDPLGDVEFIGERDFNFESSDIYKLDQNGLEYTSLICCLRKK
jgi:SAM-dependent methyltransferase